MSRHLVAAHAVRLHLVAVDDGDFVFRHALIRQAIFDELLPPELIAIAKRAVVAIECSHPGLPDDWCELATSLTETAGDHDRAGLLLVESSRRSATRGAFSTAAQMLEHGRRISSPPTRWLVEQELVSVWPRVGRARDAVVLGGELLAATSDNDDPPSERIELLNSIAVAALMIGVASLPSTMRTPPTMSICHNSIARDRSHRT